MQVAQHEIVQLERALPRPHQIGGQRGVHAQPGEGPAAGPHRVQGHLQRVPHLWQLRIGQPGRQRLLIRGVHCGHIDVSAGATRGGQCDRPHIGGDRGTRGTEGKPGRTAVPHVLAQPSGEPACLHRGTLGLEPASRLGLHTGQCGEQPVPQHAELQFVEQPVHRVAVPRAQRQLIRRGLQRHVPHQLGQLAVERDRIEVGAQRVPDLALDLIDPVDQLAQRAELLDPLGGRLLPHPRDARQVVRGVAAQRREVRVLDRGQAVLLGHRRRVVTDQVGHALARVEHRHRVVHQLQRVPVTGTDEHLVTPADGLLGERGDDVVGLVVRLGQHRDAEHTQHILHQADLALELVRCRAAVGLVLGEGSRAERLAGHVEGHGQVRRLLVAQQVDQHRGEPEDRVRDLPGGRAEVVRGDREEGAIGHRMAVDQQQPAVRRDRRGCGVRY